MDVRLILVLTLTSFSFVQIVQCLYSDDYYKNIIHEFSTEGTLSQEQFQELSIKVTGNKLLANYSASCHHRSGICGNVTSECLGYNEIFDQYSSNDVVDEVSLVKALPVLLYMSQQDLCVNFEGANGLKIHKKPSSAQAWGYGIGFVTLIVAVSNIGAFLGPCMKTQLFKRTLMFCVALAVGTLGGTGLLVLIPESLGLTGFDSPVPDYNWKMTTVIGGIYFVFLCERLLNNILKRDKTERTEEDVELDPEGESVVKKSNGHGHSHVDPEELKTKGVATVAWILLLGDSLHNFVDGLSIGAAFTENVFTGISVSIAVICEELPHELGDIAILLHSGLSIKRALLYNFLAAVICYIGLIIGIIVGENTDANRWIFAFAGGLFVYIALTDMIPEMNEQAATSRKSHTESPLQVFFYQNTGLVLGFIIIILISYYGKYIEI